ncbi:MAG: hypothetical protein IJW63_10565 [Lachnospiraceae bacterium]|nr:hypothetical protein [Lachnospiraceae bacterium]
MISKKKPILYAELSYVLGLVILAFGSACMAWGDFGMSVVVAPAYILHLKLSQYLPFFSFGMAEYMTQALVLLLLAIVLRRFKPIFLFSFVTAVLYGFLLDGAVLLVSLLPLDESFLVRLLVYSFGMVIATLSIALLFRTYIAPEAYELFVKEICLRWNLNIGKVKTIYDCVSCVIALILSFAFFGFGQFEGIKLGSIITTLINGAMIGLWGKALDKVFGFEDGLPLRKYFQ